MYLPENAKTMPQAYIHLGSKLLKKYSETAGDRKACEPVSDLAADCPSGLYAGGPVSLSTVSLCRTAVR